VSRLNNSFTTLPLALLKIREKTKISKIRNNQERKIETIIKKSIKIQHSNSSAIMGEMPRLSKIILTTELKELKNEESSLIISCL